MSPQVLRTDGAFSPAPPIKEETEAPHSELGFKPHEVSASLPPLPEEVSTTYPRDIRVHILSASGLRQADWPLTGCLSPNAYCVCEVLGKPDKRFQTQVVTTTTDPTWNTDYVIRGFRAADTLVFTVYDKVADDRPGDVNLLSEDCTGFTGQSDQLLGQAMLTCSEIAESMTEKEIPLEEVGEGVCSSLRIAIETEPQNALVHAAGALLASRGSVSSASMMSIDEDFHGRYSSQLPEVSFGLRAVWEEKNNPRQVGIRRTSLMVSHTMTTETPEIKPERSQEVLQHKSTGFIRHFISPPGSHIRLVWDLVGALLILYDSLTIPLAVFHIPQNSFTFFMDCFTLVFWTINMFTSMCVGYFRKGVVEMRFLKIVQSYVKSWFLIDLIVVVPDWVFSITTVWTAGAEAESGGSQNAVKMLRIVRLVRTMRLVRLLKLRWILVSLNDLLNSESASIIANIIKMITMLLFINHFIACVWFFIADETDEGTPTWVREHGFDLSQWDYKYLTSLHWSITQFTPASMHVQPQNSVERTFAIFIVVFGLVGFSYLVGSITNSLSQLRSMSEDHSKQFWTLRRYLKQNQVPLTLSVRVQRYLEHAWQRQKSCVSEPALVRLLSEGLQNELQCARSIPHMVVHPLIQYLNDISDVTVQRLAVKAIHRRNLARDDRLFFPGETATHVTFVIAGRLLYSKVPMPWQSSDVETHLEWVDSNEDWISEPVLWTPTWIHLGTLSAHTEAELLLVDGEQFGSIISLTPSVFTMVRGYGRRFVEWMHSQSIEELSDISQGEDISDMLRGFIDAQTSEDAGHGEVQRKSSRKRSLTPANTRSLTRTLTGWKQA